MASLVQPQWWQRARPARAPSELPFLALAAFTFVLLIAPQVLVPSLARFRLAAVAIAACVAAHLWDRWARAERVLAVPPGAGLVVAMAAWALATAPLSYWPGGSVGLFLDLYVKSLAVCWLIPGVVDTTTRLRRLVTWASVLGVVPAITALRHYAAGTFVAGGVHGDVQRIAGYDAALASNPNDLALLLNLLLPLGIGLYSLARRPLARAALAALIALQALAIVATFSRAGFLTLATTVALLIARALRGLRRFVAVLGACAALGGLAVAQPGFLRHLGSAVDVSSDATGSAQARWREVVAAAGVILDQPLTGAGLGMNILPITRETGGWRSVHDVYLQVGADLGLPGLALFLALYARCLRCAREAARGRPREPRGELSRLAGGIELALWAFAVGGLFHPAAYHFYFFYVGGLALAAGAIHARATGREPS